MMLGGGHGPLQPVTSKSLIPWRALGPMAATSVVVATCSASSVTSAGMFQMTQCTLGEITPGSYSTASGSSTIRAYDTVPSGPAVHARGGDLSSPKRASPVSGYQ